jgi:hypothetical protein
MRVMSDDLCEAVGRITADPAMLALYLHDRDRALLDLRIELSAEDGQQLEKYVHMLASPDSRAQHVLDTVLRSADRTVQR